MISTAEKLSGLEERSGFQAIMRGVENGNVSIVITKDLQGSNVIISKQVNLSR